MSIGWIKMHRQFISWEWYDDMNTKCLYLHCLLRANHSDTKWRGIDVKRGQFITSLESLSSETGLSIQKIRTSLGKLKSTGSVTSKQQAKARILTVLNYDSYQDDNKQANKQATGNQQGSNREVTTDKNVKNDKNVKSKIPYQLIVDAYHECLPELATVRSLSDARKRKIKSLWGFKIKDSSGVDLPTNTVEFWKNYFTHASTIDYIMGKKEGFDWQANFEYLITKSKFEKIIEG